MNLDFYIDQFLTLFNVEATKEDRFGFDNDKNYFVQDLTYANYNENLPYFILPISSVTNQNVKSIKYALYELITISKKDEQNNEGFDD